MAERPHLLSVGTQAMALRIVSTAKMQESDASKVLQHAKKQTNILQEAVQLYNEVAFINVVLIALPSVNTACEQRCGCK